MNDDGGWCSEVFVAGASCRFVERYFVVRGVSAAYVGQGGRRNRGVRLKQFAQDLFAGGVRVLSLQLLSD